MTLKYEKMFSLTDDEKTEQNPPHCPTMSHLLVDKDENI